MTGVPWYYYYDSHDVGTFTAVIANPMVFPDPTAEQFNPISDSCQVKIRDFSYQVSGVSPLFSITP